MHRFPETMGPLLPSEQKNKEIYQAISGQYDADALLRMTLEQTSYIMCVHERDFVPWGPEATIAQERDLILNLHERYYPVGLHSHDWLEMLCVVRGECPHCVGDQRGVLQEGDVLVVSPGTKHAFLSAQDDCMIVNLYFKIDRFEQVHQPIMHSRSILSTFLLKTLYTESLNSWVIFHTGDYFRRDNQLAALVDLWFYPQPHLRERLNNLVQMFLLDMVDCKASAPDVSIDLSNSKINDKVLMDYIDTHAATVTVQELSEVFNYSPRHIARILKRATGATCTDFIRQRRLETFLSLLVGSNMSISRAMDLSGIRSPSVFYTEFREQFGMSPADYRKKFNQFE